MTNRNPPGRTLPGWLTIFVIPSSQAPRPYPPRGMRDEVLRYLASRAPAGLVASGHIYVTGPVYFPVDVAATIVPVHDSEAGALYTRARPGLGKFLHPPYRRPPRGRWGFRA